MNKIYLAFLLVIIEWSCSSNQVSKTLAIEHSETAKRIMNKNWLEADVLVVHNPDTTLHNITRQFPAPERDDVLMLLADGTYRYDEGATKINEAHKQTFVEGQWTLDEEKRILQLTANGSTDTYNIVEVTDSTLVLTLAVVQTKKSYAYRLTFKEQSK
jgi:hypothetical protein